ncbi:hypothetical protein C8R43DRAFT_1130784 [Mycena crocata]|nr:hypothetical protein C8R43DRAFT_1130784 [Mycena crocata]
MLASHGPHPPHAWNVSHVGPRLEGGLPLEAPADIPCPEWSMTGSTSLTADRPSMTPGGPSAQTPGIEWGGSWTAPTDHIISWDLSRPRDDMSYFHPPLESEGRGLRGESRPTEYGSFAGGSHFQNTVAAPTQNFLRHPLATCNRLPAPDRPDLFSPDGQPASHYVAGIKRSWEDMAPTTTSAVLRENRHPTEMSPGKVIIPMPCSVQLKDETLLVHHKHLPERKKISFSGPIMEFMNNLLSKWDDTAIEWNPSNALLQILGRPIPYKCFPELPWTTSQWRTLKNDFNKAQSLYREYRSWKDPRDFYAQYNDGKMNMTEVYKKRQGINSSDDTAVAAPKKRQRTRLNQSRHSHEE